MAKWLKEEVKSGRAKLIHNHGLWMMPNVYPAWASRGTSCRVVMSPRGTLSEWALRHHAWRKKLFGWLFQNEALERADAFHATALSEYEDIRRLGYRQPVCILPNGIDTPPLVPKTRSGRRTLLYLGRIHKVKGIENLLHAWKAVHRRFENWELVIAGPDDRGYLAQYRALASRLALERISFPGPIYGDEKLATYRRASLFVLPTHSENFAMTVAEALAVGTPVIVTKGAPWSGLIDHDAGWWIEIGMDPLVAALEEALALPEERLRVMGENGRAWMKRDFSWASIARQMLAFYTWLLEGGPKPACVRTD